MSSISRTSVGPVELFVANCAVASDAAQDEPPATSVPAAAFPVVLL